VNAFFCWRRQPQNFENGILVVRWRKGKKNFKSKKLEAWTIGHSWCCWTPSKRMCFHAQEFTRFLSNDCVSVLSHAFWRVLSNKVIWVTACWVNISRTHTSERHSLLFKGCLRPTVTVMQSDLNYVNKRIFFNDFGSTITSTILRIRTTGACAPDSRRMKL